MDRTDTDWQLVGLWWLPDDPEARVHGTLKYSATDGARLELVGRLGASDNPLTSVARFDVVRGVGANNEKVTLVDGFEESGSLIDFVGIAPSVVRPSLVLIGAGFDKAEDLKFDSVSGRFAQLQAWVRVSGFEFRWDVQFTSWSVTYNRPQPLEYRLNNGVTVRILFGLDGPRVTAPLTSVRTEQRVFLEIASSRPQSFDVLYDHLIRAADLVALAVGEPATVQSLGVTCDSVRTPGGVMVPMEVYLGNRTHVGPAPKVCPNEMLFTLPDVHVRFEQMLGMWFGRRRILEPTYQLYFAALKSPTMYVEHRLLNFFQALESYHRRSEPIPPEDMRLHRAHVDRIVAAISDEAEGRWLREALQYSNQPTARERLEHIVRKLEADWLFGEDCQNAVKEITNARNRLTHWDKRYDNAELDVKALYNHSVRLQLLCELVFLNELGFSNIESRKLMENSVRLKRRLAY